MSPDALVVVGDRFESFIGNRNTVSVSALLQRLHTGDVPTGLSITVGQGLSAEQLREVERLLKRSGPRVSLANGKIPVHAERRVTHKHNPRNVMISAPKRLAEDRFTVDTVIDEHNEMLEDHLTGQHIPGMALVEAARQMWTAVTEEFFLKDSAKTRFVVSSINSTFRSYVFPLPTTLQYQLLNHESNAVGQMFHCLITVHQGGAQAAEIEAQYRVILEPLSEKQESIAARQAIANQLSQLKSAVDAMNGAYPNGSGVPR